MQTRLSSSTVNRPVVLRTGPSRAIALWQVGTAILSRRTLDGGTTWTPTATVTTGINLDFSASALGNYVDLAYVKKVTSNGTTSLRLYYKRSLDAGVTWQTAQRLTSTVSKVMDQGVARGPNGQVSVVWTGYSTGNLYTRSSTDGGTTFTSARYVGHTGNWEPGRTITYRSDPAVAIGSGVIYVAYTADTDTLAVRRTTDRGLHWSAAKTLSTHAADRPALIAAGSQAMIGYTSTATGPARAIVRRTTDKGVTWSVSATLTRHASATFSMTPQLAYRDGVLAVHVQVRPGRELAGMAPPEHELRADLVERHQGEPRQRQHVRSRAGRTRHPRHGPLGRHDGARSRHRRRALGSAHAVGRSDADRGCPQPTRFRVDMDGSHLYPP